MSVLRVSMIFDFRGLAEKTQQILRPVAFICRLFNCAWHSARDRCLRPAPRRFYLSKTAAGLTALPFLIVIIVLFVFLTGPILTDVNLDFRRDEIGVAFVVDFEADGGLAFL